MRENDPVVTQDRPSNLSSQSNGVFTLENRAPVIRGTFDTVRVRLSRAPDVPIAFRMVFVGSRLDEPIVLGDSVLLWAAKPARGHDYRLAYLVRSVVNHEVHAEAMRHV